MSIKYLSAVVLTAVAGFCVLLAVNVKYKPCEDCHCKSDGMCCCSGTYCSPTCDCKQCSCKKPTRTRTEVACDNCGGKGRDYVCYDCKGTAVLNGRKCPCCVGGKCPFPCPICGGSGKLIWER